MLLTLQQSNLHEGWVVYFCFCKHVSPTIDLIPSILTVWSFFFLGGKQPMCKDCWRLLFYLYPYSYLGNVLGDCVDWTPDVGLGYLYITHLLIMLILGISLYSFSLLMHVCLFACSFLIRISNSAPIDVKSEWEIF